MKLFKTALLSFACMLLPAVSQAVTVCPALTNASSAYYTAATAAGTNCNTLITINADNSVTLTFPNTHPYDGSDDNYVGVINNSASSISNLSITGSTDLFGFDGDGIDYFGIAGNTTDLAAYGAYAYGGTDAYFTSIIYPYSSGTVNFIGGILGNGGTGYFSLEEAPSAASFQTIIPSAATPEPSALILFSTGALGMVGVVKRRFSF